MQRSDSLQMPLGLDEMCMNPVEVSVRGIRTLTSCQKCWQCRENRKRDLVGRCIAEARFTKHVSVITLTYGTDRTVGVGKTTNLSASILTYSDVQKWLKRLRKAGFPLRYVIAGEYGSFKGRCHWHVIAFWQDKPPPHPPFVPGSGGVKWWYDPFWTKEADGKTPRDDSSGGYSHWDHFTAKTAAYVCKYMMKDERDPHSQSIVKWSKHPILGAEYFKELAERHCSAGIVPQQRIYSFADVIDPKTGKPRVFYMNEATLDFFCAQLIAQWMHRYGEHPLDRQHSDLIMQYMDRQAQRLTSEALEVRQFVKAPKGRPVDLLTGEVYPMYWDHCLNTFVTWAGDGSQQYWTVDQYGNRSWQSAISRAPSEIERICSSDSATTSSVESEKPLTSERYRKLSNGG